MLLYISKPLLIECICGLNHPNVLVKRIDSHTISQAVMKRTAHWLVVSTPLKSMSSSVGVTTPNIWKNKIHFPNHQPAHVLIDAVATCTYIIVYPSDRTSVWGRMNSPRTDIAPFCDRIKSSRPQRPKGSKRQQLGDHLQGYGRLQKFMERISNFCSHSSLQHISIPWRSPWRKYVWNDDRHIPKSTHSGLSSDLEPQQPQRVTSPISWTEKQTSEKKTRKTTCWALNKTLSEVMWFKQSYGYHFQNFHFIINMCGFSRWYSINHSQWLVTMALFYRSSHGSPKVQVIPIMVKPQALPCPLVNWHN